MNRKRARRIVGGARARGNHVEICMQKQARGRRDRHSRTGSGRCWVDAFSALFRSVTRVGYEGRPRRALCEVARGAGRAGWERQCTERAVLAGSLLISNHRHTRTCGAAAARRGEGQRAAGMGGGDCSKAVSCDCRLGRGPGCPPCGGALLKGSVVPSVAAAALAPRMEYLCIAVDVGLTWPRMSKNLRDTDGLAATSTWLCTRCCRCSTAR